MKRYLVLAGMILLATLIYRYEEKPRVETSVSHISPPELALARMAVPQLSTNSHFLDNINLSYEPVATIHDPNPRLAVLAYERNLPLAGLGKLQPKPGDTTEPALTVADRKINYELLGSEGFSLKLNLTPGYPNPAALVPTRLDPGVGVSIKF